MASPATQDVDSELARLNETNRLLVLSLVSSAQRNLLALGTKMRLSPKQVCTLVLVAEGTTFHSVDERAVYNLVGNAIGHSVDEGNVVASLDYLSDKFAARALVSDLNCILPGGVNDDKVAYIGSLQASASEPLTVETLAEAIAKRRQSSFEGNNRSAAMRASQSM